MKNENINLQVYKTVLDNIDKSISVHQDYDELLDAFEFELQEGNVAVDAIAGKAFSAVRRSGQDVRKTKDIGQKIDRLSMQMDRVASLGLLSTVMSGSRKGLLGKGSRLFSIVKSMSK
ncbi:MAG TPA: hypothetical protein EYO31_00210 [Phycisphaerales bacterium]|nr:hypothetical protein [Phycisphaerales bacterium]